LGLSVKVGRGVYRDLPDLGWVTEAGIGTALVAHIEDRASIFKTLGLSSAEFWQSKEPVHTVSVNFNAAKGGIIVPAGLTVAT